MSERKALADWMRRWVADGNCPMDRQDLLRAADILDPPARGRTKRVKLAVAMGADGEWYGVGAGTWDDEAAADGARAGSPATKPRVSFVVADVPLPEETTVEGEVS